MESSGSKHESGASKQPALESPAGLGKVKKVSLYPATGRPNTEKKDK
jgi:hypothetical protein